MSDTDSTTDRIDRLRDRVEADAGSVSFDELTAAIEDASAGDRRRIVEVIDRKLVSDPETADRLADAVVPYLAYDDDDLRTVAATVLERLAGRHPEAVTPAVDDLAGLLHDEYPFARRHAVWALAHVSGHAPERVAPLVPDLRPEEGESAYFEQEHLLTLLENVAAVDPNAVVPLTDALVEALEAAVDGDDDLGDGVYSPGMAGPLDDDQFKDPIDTERVAAELVATVGEEAPAALVPHVDDLVGVLELGHRTSVRRNVAAALASVAETDPAAVESAVPALAAELGAEEVPLRTYAARTLGLVAADAPERVTEAVTPHVTDLEPLLREGTPPVRAAAAGLLSYVGEEDPAAVEPVVDALVAALDEDDVVAGAVGSEEEPDHGNRSDICDDNSEYDQYWLQFGPVHIKAGLDLLFGHDNGYREHDDARAEYDREKPRSDLSTVGESPSDSDDDNREQDESDGNRIRTDWVVFTFHSDLSHPGCVLRPHHRVRSPVGTVVRSRCRSVRSSSLFMLNRDCKSSGHATTDRSRPAASSFEGVESDGDDGALPPGRTKANDAGSETAISPRDRARR